MWSFSIKTHTGRGTQVWHTFNNTFNKNTNPLKASFKSQTWLTDLKSTRVTPLKRFYVFYCSMFAPCKSGRAVLSVFSLRLEKLVRPGEVLLLQTHYTHTHTHSGTEAVFFSSLNGHTSRLQLIPQGSRDRSGKKGVTHFTVKSWGTISAFAVVFLSLFPGIDMEDTYCASKSFFVLNR